jgi:hypothetical protein
MGSYNLKFFWEISHHPKELSLFLQSLLGCCPTTGLLTWQTTVDDREAPAELFKIPTCMVAAIQHFPSSKGARIPEFFQLVDVLDALQERPKAILAEELANLDMNGLVATRSPKVYVVCQD